MATRRGRRAVGAHVRIRERGARAVDPSPREGEVTGDS